MGGVTVPQVRQVDVGPLRMQLAELQHRIDEYHQGRVAREAADFFARTELSQQVGRILAGLRFC